MSATAYTIDCDRCGGKIGLAELPPSITCPYCQHVQAISPERRASLLQYQSDVAHALGRAADEHAKAESWDRWYGGRGGRSRNATLISMALFGGMFALLLVLGFVAQALVTSGDPSLRAFGELLMPIATPILVGATVVGQIVWYYGGERRARRAATPPRTQATCPRCGATNALAAGQVLERCTHCGASLMPSTTMMHAGIDAAEALRFRAEIERHRTERSGMASALRASASNAMPYVILGSWVPLTLFPVIAFTVDAIGKGTAEPGLVLLWAFAAFNVSLIVFVFLWRRSRRERWAWTLDRATIPFPHRPLVGLDGMVGWLNEHWAGPIALTEISAGPYFGATAIGAREYMGMVVLNPKRFAEGYPGYVSVFIAAWVPALHAPHDGGGQLDARALAPQRTALDAMGFRLSVERAGLRAFAPEEVAQRLGELPNGGALLSQVVTILLDVARITNARPIVLPAVDGN